MIHIVYWSILLMCLRIHITARTQNIVLHTTQLSTLLSFGLLLEQVGSIVLHIPVISSIIII